MLIFLLEKADDYIPFHECLRYFIVKSAGFMLERLSSHGEECLQYETCRYCKHLSSQLDVSMMCAGGAMPLQSIHLNQHDQCSTSQFHHVNRV